MAYEIGLDIGHGENTWESGGGKGVKKNGKVYEEHHFNSAVAIIVEKRLKEHGFKVFMAQKPFKNDVPLRTRTNQYNSRKVDAVVSIHANAGVATASGACSFYWHTSKKGKRLSDLFVKNWKAMVKGVGIHGNGQHASMKGSWTNLHMVRETKMEAILVECGFMTNANDFEYIFGKHKDEYIPQVAEAIVKTICEYFNVAYKESTEKQPVKKVDTKGKHKIQRGDTFYSIARKYNVSVQDLMNANKSMNPRALKVGAYVTIPTKKNAPVKSKPAPKKQPDMKTNSIVTYLNSIGEDSSFTNRKKLAQKYGIKNYTGTASQNLKLLDLLRKGAPAKPEGDQKTTSIVDYLVSIKVDSSFANRKKLAQKYGIKNYTGTASQNTQLLKKIRGH